MAAGLNTSAQMSARKTFALGIYLLASFLLQMAVLVAVWPIPGPDGKWDQTWKCLLFFDSKCPICDDARLIVLVLVCGGVGAMVHAVRSFSAHIGARRLSNGWGWWYILRPFEGAIIALAFYFVLRGGLLTSNSANSSSAATISVYGVSGMAVLVGMFSHEAVEKLKALAETVFAKAQSQPGAISSPPNPVPTVASVDPASMATGTSNAKIKINGTNFVKASETHVSGEPRPTTFISATELAASLTPEDVKQANADLRITVTNPPPGGGESVEDIKLHIR